MLFFQSGYFGGITDAAGHDAVNQRTAEGALFVDVSTEVFAQTPLVDILVDALLQFLAVVVDQLTGQDQQAALAGVVTLQQHLSHLAGEGCGGHIFQLAGRIVDDTGLGGVGNDDFQIVADSHFHHLTVAFGLIGIQAAGHAGDNTLVVHLLTVLAATQIQGVQAFLLVDHLSKAGSDGLHQAALAIPAGLLIGQVEPVVHKATQEVAFAELQYLFRCFFQNVSVIAGFFQGFIVK